MPATHIDAVLDQIDYAVKLIGVDHVGIGSDFDGVSGDLPVELRSVADYPNLVAGLQARGHSRRRHPQDPRRQPAAGVVGGGEGGSEVICR